MATNQEIQKVLVCAMTNVTTTRNIELPEPKKFSFFGRKKLIVADFF